MSADAAIRAAADAGDLDRAITLAIEGYGDELYRFLCGLTGDHDEAADVFSAACERAWRGLAAFRWESSLRTWLYRITRNELSRAKARPRRDVPLSAVPSIERVIAKVRTEAPLHQLTVIKDRFAKVREELPPDDHLLLCLRLERELPWNEIAAIMEVEAATLRKRFERLKKRLMEIAEELRGDH